MSEGAVQRTVALPLPGVAETAVGAPGGVPSRGVVVPDPEAGERFPAGKLADGDGFSGIDGAFRFRDSIAERALEVREVGQGARVVSPAPGGFGG